MSQVSCNLGVALRGNLTIVGMRSFIKSTHTSMYMSEGPDKSNPAVSRGHLHPGSVRGPKDYKSTSALSEKF